MLVMCSQIPPVWDTERHRLPGRAGVPYRGLLAADWKETETGREAKFYRLTRKGLQQLKTETADWERLIDAIGLILGMADGGAP